MRWDYVQCKRNVEFVEFSFKVDTFVSFGINAPDFFSIKTQLGNPYAINNYFFFFFFHNQPQTRKIIVKTCITWNIRKPTPKEYCSRVLSF